MSLDVYLKIEGEPATKSEERIFIREAGQTRELSRAEWDARFPDREPTTVNFSNEGEVFHRNITHNLGEMAKEAGIYEALWRPDEIGITKAKQLKNILADGFALLSKDPERFKKLNPENGWGTYEQLVEFVGEYCVACISHPDADVVVSR